MLEEKTLETAQKCLALRKRKNASKILFRSIGYHSAVSEYEGALKDLCETKEVSPVVRKIGSLFGGCENKKEFEQCGQILDMLYEHFSSYIRNLVS
jgi:hypothetical protein